jgi:hypothetical protein
VCGSIDQSRLLALLLLLAKDAGDLTTERTVSLYHVGASPAAAASRIQRQPSRFSVTVACHVLGDGHAHGGVHQVVEFLYSSRIVVIHCQ